MSAWETPRLMCSTSLKWLWCLACTCKRHTSAH